MRTVDRYKGALWLNYVSWTQEEQRALQDASLELTTSVIFGRLCHGRGFQAVMAFKGTQLQLALYAPQEEGLPFQQRISIGVEDSCLHNVARLAYVLVMAIQDDMLPCSVASRPRYWKEQGTWLK